MKRTTDRIITTHVGSLPRPERLEALLIQRDHGKPIDQSEFAREVDSALE
jgi:5-methyltetrahydropteroyltriglutamate--homocysteine methyltransferase